MSEEERIENVAFQGLPYGMCGSFLLCARPSRWRGALLCDIL
ncbi:hypothetical protein SELSPUOL_01691 [Selenomonas sputigena ATCC 35185]|uniref:Uncharacterized protein n=1 Tax=Selenomonas sputigena (strain ATCC 35185 / DSM 20758 / CCUG 44933 / VPI D19B-28) TaxID=546271 RepID=C9LW39_SELS3|nr:hypothetical protein SELSPUOL_01691 [Selenomonas sputigena ATCC 35185]